MESLLHENCGKRLEELLQWNLLLFTAPLFGCSRHQNKLVNNSQKAPNVPSKFDPLHLLAAVPIQPAGSLKSLDTEDGYMLNGVG